MPAKRKRGKQLLSSSRQRLDGTVSRLSSRHTRALIRRHHVLRKQLKVAEVKNDRTTQERLQFELNDAGGLERYQEASAEGQSTDRGGDSSKILVQWLKDAGITNHQLKNTSEPLRMLEVGSLQIQNACSRSKIFEIERTDLYSRHALIKEEDFLQRPAPSHGQLQSTGFDVVSLSLVLNFVENAVDRGIMLRKAGQILRVCHEDRQPYSEYFPCLFLVLPAQCIQNSRYLDADLLRTLMDHLGFQCVREKQSAKLIYQLWKYGGNEARAKQVFKKREVRSGGTRNNFAIVLE